MILICDNCHKDFDTNKDYPEVEKLKDFETYINKFRILNCRKCFDNRNEIKIHDKYTVIICSIIIYLLSYIGFRQIYNMFFLNTINILIMMILFSVLTVIIMIILFLDILYFTSIIIKKMKVKNG